MKNYIEEWMKDNNLEVNQKFKIEGFVGDYLISENYLLLENGSVQPFILINLLAGSEKIVNNQNKIKDHFKEIFKLLPEDSDFYPDVCICSIGEKARDGCNIMSTVVDCKKCWFECVGMEEKDGE